MRVSGSIRIRWAVGWRSSTLEVMMMRLVVTGLCLALASLVVGTALVDAKPASAASSLADVTSYVDAIQPIFEAKCVRCHSPKSHKGELDLSSPKSLRRGGESGPAVVANDPDGSILYEKVHAGEMPPDKKDRLTEQELRAIREWIAAGAKTSLATSETPSLTQHDVIPILLRHCTYCHGLRQKKGDLDLTSRAGMLKGGKSGPAIVLGKPSESRLIERIQKVQMPPPTQLVEGCVKPVDPSETETLVNWIAAGAPEIVIEPDVATTAPDPLVSDKDRDFWAFKPPVRSPIPPVKNASWVRNPIDAFVLKMVEEKGLAPALEADRLTLLRRASFDLTGLPPEPDEVQSFLDDTRPDAYERLIDRLLASPRYGERWGKYWLDLAGYSDSEGKREQDLPRPQAWRFRDYVVKSFNHDKPYDRFLVEQLAGDELADYEHAKEITDEIADKLTATGFLRMAPDATWANITGYPADRVDVIADEVDILGSVVMGLTMKCARCHSHKFDPIPHRDYYRLIDVFKGAYDEYDWLKPDVRQGLGPVSVDVLGGRLLTYVTTAERRVWEANQARITEESKAVRDSIDALEKRLAAKYLEEKLATFPESIRGELKTMLETPAASRNAHLKELAEKYEKELRIDREALKKRDPDFQMESDKADAQLKKLEAERSEAPAIQALWDRGNPSPTYIYRRGDINTPGRLVGPGVPSVLTDGKTPFDVSPPFPGAKSTGRRLAFARWVTRPDHPLTARVAVNRIWKHHFGSGIVKTLGNFGKAGTPPTHPELLDWLAREFIENGWRAKPLHKLMMTSATYRQASRVTPEQETADRDNALYARMPLSRLDAESLYDTMLLVAGRLVEKRGGPPDPVDVRPDGLVTPAGAAEGWRRMIHVRQSRKKLPTHLETFDYPQMNPNCIERRDSVVATQALQLMNTAMVQNLADGFAERVAREAGMDRSKQVERAYLIALSRKPTEEERTIADEAIRELTDRWSKSATHAGKPTPERKALATFCHALLNSAAFLYVD